MRPAPADEELLGLFEASVQNAEETARLLHDLLAGYPERAALAEDIVRCERDGDRIAHDILHRLARRGTRAALDPADLHALARALDDVVDFAEEAADQLAIYAVEAPMESAQDLAAVLVRCTEELAHALHGLATGRDLAAHLQAVHVLERRGDQLRRVAVASLFATGVDPLLVIRWKDIFETLEAAVDACATAANILEGVVLKAGRRAVAYPATASSSA
jgi:uncharacterized protein Yka (UPF0111/DUF47 family)